MIIGTNAYAPGLTVRWYYFSATQCSLYATREQRYVAICEGDALRGYVVLCRFPDRKTVDEPFARRCDAKRAAEVLVGQWWREKCEREWLAKRCALATSDGLVAAFKRMGEAAREVAERFNVLTARGGDLDRLAEVYGVEARGEE